MLSQLIWQRLWLMMIGDTGDPVDIDSAMTTVMICIHTIPCIIFHRSASFPLHYSYVIMSDMAPQITSLSTVYSTVCSGAHQRKHQSSVLSAFGKGILRWPVNSPHKGPVTQKIFSFDDAIMKERISLHHIPPKKVMEYLESTMETLVFGILMCWKWLGSNHREVFWFNATLTCSVLNENVICKVFN